MVHLLPFLGRMPEWHFALLPTIESVGRRVIVHHKVKQSYISRMVSPRIAKFYMNLHTGQVYNHIGYDVTTYRRSEVIDVRKTAENAGSNGFGSNVECCGILLAPPLGGHLVELFSWLQKRFCPADCLTHPDTMTNTALEATTSLSSNNKQNN